MLMCRRRHRSNLLHLRRPRRECSAKAHPAVDCAQQAPAGRSAAGCCSVALRGGCHSQAEALGTMSDAYNSARGQRLLKTNAGTGLPSPLPLGQCSTSIRPVALRSLPCHTGNLHERHASGPQLYELLGRNLSLVYMSLHRRLWCVSCRVCLEAVHTQVRLRFVVLWSQFGLDLCSGGLMHDAGHAICQG